MDSESLTAALVSFGSAVVVFMTAIIGYFKVLKPAQSKSGDITDTDRLIKLNERLSKTEHRVDRVESQLAECEKERLKLKKENYSLLRENSRLRSGFTNDD